MASPTAKIPSIKTLEITNKIVFMRLDFNVPLSTTASGERHIDDDSRIQEALPTIKFAIEKGARLVLASHLGRPDGKVIPEFSLEPVAKHLAGLLGKDVTLADDCVGEGIEMMAKNLKAGQILMLENLRFHAEEEENNLEFSKQLAALADVYITDAFGTAHRKHASTFGVPSLMPIKGMGFLIEKELLFIDPLLHNPAKPFVAIMGGSKVTDKIKTLESLIRRVDKLLIGGAMGHAFWLAQGETLPSGAKQPKPADVDAARALMRDAKKREMPLIVPLDTNLGFDIGPKTVARFIQECQGAKTIFWNGPLGWFEKPEYAVGTFEVARAIGEMKALKIIGGGDTVSAVKLSGAASHYDHLSTGGGAVLEYLEGDGLPGIDVLRISYRDQHPKSEQAPET